MQIGSRAKLWVYGIVFLLGLAGAGSVDAADKEVNTIDPAEVEELKERDRCPIIISIMSSRCSACRKELPVYQSMHEQYQDQGLGIFVISVDFGNSNQIQALVDRMDLTYPVFWGGEEVMQAYDISLVPYKLVVRNSKTVEESIGAWSDKEIEQKIMELIKDCDD
ncbi:MAG: TlpA family protein disulfide reductase [Thermodesulfobacteriota bacterium]